MLERYPAEYEFQQIGRNHVHAVVCPTWPIHRTKTATLPGGKETFEPKDSQGAETFRELLPRLDPDLVFAFNDPQHLECLCDDASDRKHKLVLYTNFDGFPVPPCCHRLFKADRIFTMSEFAKNAFLESHPEEDHEKVAVIYAPADTARFHAVSAEDKLRNRQDLFPEWMPDNAFVLAWVGMNQWRKQNWVMYHLIHLLRTGDYLVCSNCKRAALPRSHFLFGTESSSGRGIEYECCPHCTSRSVSFAQRLDDIFLWIHSPRDFPRAAWSAVAMECIYRVRQDQDIYYTEGCHNQAWLAPDDMSVLYQLWDCLLFLSGGEGFGVPAWEAMSSELPVIYTDYSSHAEFLRKANAGIPVGGILQPEPGSCILRLVPDVTQALDAVRRLYADAKLRSSLV